VGDRGYATKKAEESKLLESSKFSEKEEIDRFKPNVIAYSSIINCWSKSGSKDASNHVEKLSGRMEFNGIKPNMITYTSCLATYARSDSETGAKKASDLLTRMKKMYRDTGDESLKPTIVSYFSVIDGWARSDSKDAGVEAEQLLREVEDLYRGGDLGMKPDVGVYARVIAAHSKSRKKGSDGKAIGLLRRMQKFALTGDENVALAKPNVVCYNTLIGSYGRRGLPINAFNILNQMDQFNSRITDESDKVIADEHSLNSIIYALSRSDLKGKAQKAMKMLERLENSHIDGNWRCKPSARRYNMVIATCSNTFKSTGQEKSQALAIALNVFQRLKTSQDLDTDKYT
jgi:pentatricopeptide repeat protein